MKLELLTKETAKVGQEVTCLLWGKGVIINIDYDSTYCINVKFESGEDDSYTIDGSLYLGQNIAKTLYLGHHDIEARIKDEEELKCGDLVWVKNDEKWSGYKLAFIGKLNDKYYCLQCTSSTPLVFVCDYATKTNPFEKQKQKTYTIQELIEKVAKTEGLNPDEIEVKLK